MPKKGHCISMKKITEKGMTLIELTVVLLILVALAGLVIPYIGGTSRKALCDATDVSMANIKKVIMGRYYLDTLGAYPSDSNNTNYSLNYLFNAGGRADFDLDSQVGWNGPYLQSGLILKDGEEYSPANLGSFASNGTHMHIAFADGQSVVLDSWGRPFILQVTGCSNWGISTITGNCARLVSAGFGYGIGLENGSIDTQILDDTGTTALEQHRQNDDRILYLNAPRPAVDENPRCD